jgi:heme a synthase
VVRHSALAAINEPLTLDTSRRAVAIWLFVCAAMVYAILIVGGITRLTRSGLSIVEWKPLVGALPPMSGEAWAELFDKYRSTPEYKLVNFDLTLDGFQFIFWWEYAHRLMGRLVGVAFLLPLFWFIATRRVSRALSVRLAVIFGLGAAQGALGWYMVASGLVDKPWVSPFRLMAHLALALLIVAAMCWTAWDLWYAPQPREAVPAAVKAVAALVFIMALSGAMVAGTHAGFAYNTFPLMAGSVIPPDLMRLSPWYENFVHNVTTVQFVHRAIAWLLIAAIPSLWWWIRRTTPVPVARLQSDWMLAALVVQVSLGIATLLSIVALPLAAAHQAGAVLLFASVLWTAYALRVKQHWGQRASEPRACSHYGDGRERDESGCDAGRTGDEVSGQSRARSAGRRSRSHDPARRSGRETSS